MTNTEQAKLNTFAGLNSFLQSTVAIYATDVSFSAKKARFDEKYAATLVAAAKAGVQNTGFSQEKLDKKNIFGQKAATLAGFAYDVFIDNNLISKAEQLYTADTNYTNVSDAEAASRGLALVQLLNENITLLSADDDVTAADVTALSGVLASFMNAQGSSDSAHQTSPADTATFKASVKVTINAMDSLRRRGRFFQESNNEFYNDLVLVCQIATVNVHHTNIDVTVLKTENNQVIEGATFSYSRSTKTSISNYLGYAHIDHIINGAGTITVTFPGRKSVTQHVNIQRSHDNSFTVHLEVE